MAAADSSACQRRSGVAGCRGPSAAGVGGAAQLLVHVSWEGALPSSWRRCSMVRWPCAVRQAMRMAVQKLDACRSGPKGGRGGWSRFGSAGVSCARCGPAAQPPAGAHASFASAQAGSAPPALPSAAVCRSQPGKGWPERACLVGRGEYSWYRRVEDRELCGGRRCQALSARS